MDRVAREGALSEEELRLKRAELERRLSEAQSQWEHTQDRLTREEAALTNELMSKMRSVVREVAKTRGYLLVLDKSGLLFASPAEEITDEVVSRYDQHARFP